MIKIKYSCATILNTLKNIIRSGVSRKKLQRLLVLYFTNFFDENTIQTNRIQVIHYKNFLIVVFRDSYFTSINLPLQHYVVVSRFIVDY